MGGSELLRIEIFDPCYCSEKGNGLVCVNWEDSLGGKTLYQFRVIVSLWVKLSVE